VLDPFKPVIDQWLAGAPGLQARRIHQDLARDYGFVGSYQTVRRYVERTRPVEREPVEERFETAPGHQAQVDWSHEQPIHTPGGLELPLYAFHMILGHSRDAFLGLVGSMNLVTFWACHRAAFAHFGGVPREILYDRTKTVIRAHVGLERRAGDRVYHPEALASAHHYGFSLRLCRARRAKTKGKVESDVRYVRGRLLHAHRFRSYERANARWSAWNQDVARARVHATHGEIVAERALRDRAALLALPARPYLVAQRTTRKIARDGLFSFEGRRYLVPGAKPGDTVELRLAADETSATPTPVCCCAGTSEGARLGCCPTRRHHRSRSHRCSGRCPRSRCTAGRFRHTRRRSSVAELITQRIRANATELRLHGIAESPDALIERAEEAKLGYREFLDLLLENEAGVLEGRRYTARLKMAGLPNRKTLEEFDVTFQPELDPKRLAELRSLRFIERKVSCLILGPPGVGKSHIAVGLAMEALARGYLVRYSTLDDLVRGLRQADALLGRLPAKLAQLQRPHLLVIDEVGFTALEREDANRVFQAINRRYTRGSIVLTSNKTVAEWAGLFGEEALAAAILDRLLHDAEVLAINGPSYRLKGRLDELRTAAQRTQDETT
jgi:DNA replication protein DnaC/transposase